MALPNIHINMPSNKDIFGFIERKQKLTGTIEERNKILADWLNTTPEYLQDVRDGKKEFTLQMAPKMARIQEKVPLMYLAYIGYNIAKREKNEIDEDMWYTLLQRNTSGD